VKLTKKKKLIKQTNKKTKTSRKKERKKESKKDRKKEKVAKNRGGKAKGRGRDFKLSLLLLWLSWRLLSAIFFRLLGFTGR
jgi:hypothetical protein